MNDDLMIYAKTAAADAEIKTRALRLSPRLRSLLIVVDGKRSTSDYVDMLGPEAQACLQQLLALNLIVVVHSAPAPVRAPRPDRVSAAPVAVAAAAAVAAAPAPASATVSGLIAATEIDIANDLQRLPAATTRSAKDIEMSRHFMINTVNLVFGHNMRLSLVRSIFECQSTDALRAVYPRWFSAMSENRNGAKRMAEWRTKLAATL